MSEVVSLDVLTVRISYKDAIENLGLLASLRSFDPSVIGTPPLGIDVSDSDIDVACHCEDLDRFAEFASLQFGSQDGFELRRATLQNHDSVIVQFNAFGWEFEIFCQPIPTNNQWGVRHFRIEQRLLALSPDLKPAVLALKRSGLKTEPAFAEALGLSGDPYVAILDLEQTDETELLAIATTR